MEPFKVTFTFRSPLIVQDEYPTHLDGLLAWCVAEEATEIGLEDPWERSFDLSHLLAQEKPVDAHAVWKASQVIFTPATEIMLAMNMTRKTEAIDYVEAKDANILSMKAENLRTDSGQMRNYQMLVAVQWMAKAEAWGIGDIDEIRKALRRLRGIGKQTRNGYGLLRSTQVTACPDALDKWRLRTLPNEIAGTPGVAYAPCLSRVAPPYWQKATMTMAKAPILMPEIGDGQKHA
jgi:CRISPR type IV-associated protein Csf3